MRVRRRRRGFRNFDKPWIQGCISAKSRVDLFLANRRASIMSIFQRRVSQISTLVTRYLQRATKGCANMIIPVRCFSCGKVPYLSSPNVHIITDRARRLLETSGKDMSSSAPKRFQRGRFSPSSYLLLLTFLPNNIAQHADALFNSDVMDQLGCKRYCCRRMLMTHVDLIEKLLK